MELQVLPRWSCELNPQVRRDFICSCENPWLAFKAEIFRTIAGVVSRSAQKRWSSSGGQVPLFPALRSSSSPPLSASSPQLPVWTSEALSPFHCDFATCFPVPTPLAPSLTGPIERERRFHARNILRASVIQGFQPPTHHSPPPPLPPLARCWDLSTAADQIMPWF